MKVEGPIPMGPKMDIKEYQMPIWVEKLPVLGQIQVDFNLPREI